LSIHHVPALDTIYLPEIFVSTHTLAIFYLKTIAMDAPLSLLTSICIWIGHLVKIIYDLMMRHSIYYIRVEV